MIMAKFILRSWLLLALTLTYSGTALASTVFTSISGQRLSTNKIEAIDVSNIKEVTVIFFWASWCDFCKAFSRDLSRVAAAYPELKLIGMSTDAKIEDALKGAAYYRFIKRHYWVPKPAGSGFFPSIIPYYVIVSKDGKIDSVYEGNKPDKVEYFQKRVRYLIRGDVNEEQ
ncbi:MAG: redoxin domain-containing protein [Proteobacteria bacterium]|nr:MAG: redoxin domain-containing protein [Pseudomonadota bacterium]